MNDLTPITAALHRSPTESPASATDTAASVGGYKARAWRIVDRVLPALPKAHGFWEPGSFIAASRRLGERDRLFWRTFARLRAKAEGGAPYIRLPVGHDGYGAMAQVARELLTDSELQALSNDHKRWKRIG